MKAWKLMCSVLLLVCLLAGCTMLDTSNTQRADGEQDRSGQADGRGAVAGDETWRQAYYDAAVQVMEQNQGLTLQSMTVYYMQDDLPQICLQLEDGNYSLWKIQNEQAVMVHSWNAEELRVGKGYQFLGVNTESGNPIFYSYTDEGARHVVVEIEAGTEKEIPLYEYRNDAGYSRTLYTFADKKTWSGEEENTEYPVQHMPISYGGDTLKFYSEYFDITDKVRRQMLSDYFLNSYAPDIPTEAPPWVYEYVRHIRTHMPFAYMPVFTHADAFNIKTQLGMEALDIFKANSPEGAPFIQIYNWNEWGGSFMPPYAMLGTKGMYTYEIYWEDWYDFYEDSEGVLIASFSGIGYSDWYRPGSEGMEFLFGEESSMSEPGHYYVGPQRWDYQTFDESDDGWVEQARENILRQHGYTPPIKEAKPASYPLPEECTWAQLEATLIDALCSYAQETGEWNT